MEKREWLPYAIYCRECILVFKNTFDEYIFFKDKRDEGKRVDFKGTRL